ncbi:MAG TPA: hypothetical protein VFE58_19460 [Tepidisphaeraceae bacterium]|jgi:ppGpp synthetase/RelA/SpoT-type nucleotidyltranferase|nr:hypothetical protein [Tepidisphaeraceae bacterium]
MTKSQIDRLAKRLKEGASNDDDLRLLDEYRRSFSEAYGHVIKIIRETLKLEPTGRPAKSTLSIVEKLRRESIRLSQIQDIAGCRITVDDILAQNKVIAELQGTFGHAIMSDRRQHPSHGYRAVHVIVQFQEKLIEVQVRTHLQHLWAQLSEKYADAMNPAIKYGGGPKSISAFLQEMSDMIADLEMLHQRWSSNYFSLPNAEHTDTISLASQREEILKMQQTISDLIMTAMNSIPKGNKP